MTFEDRGIRFLNIVLGSLFLGAIVFLGLVPEQSDFEMMLPALVFAFGSYFWMISRELSKQQVFFFIALGVLARLSLLFTFPNFSDDIYRFIWDGRLLNSGINPFDYLPSYYIEEGQSTIPGITVGLYEALNSQAYFTIYPPLAQAVFYVSTWLSPNSLVGSAILMKLFLLACELGTLYLLYDLLKDKKLVLIYALNPLIIIEIMGNLHFEGAMLFFLLLAYYLLLKERLVWSAVAFSLAVISKLLPLMFLPFLIRRLGWKRSIQYFLIIGFLVLLSFLPLYSPVFIENISQSFDLYFRRFEFNASLYYFVRWIGYEWRGYNLIGTIGPSLALFSTSLILLLALFEKRRSIDSLAESWFWAICIYLLFTTTIHPWYTSLPILLCLFGKSRFPVLWSGLIMLTYINYSYADYFENLWVVGFEYLLVLVYLIWEWRQRKKAAGNKSNSAMILS